MRFQKLLIKAKNNDSDAQFNVAQIYLSGTGQRRNLKKAIYWLEQSANLSNIKALLRLGELYWCGSGKMPENTTKALTLFKKSAQLGSVKAQYMLGAILATDKKFYNPIEAVIWYQMAADSGDVEALHNLGVMYCLGEGVKQDKKKGEELIGQARKRNL
jgi:TPR repeat protein